MNMLDYKCLGTVLTMAAPTNDATTERPRAFDELYKMIERAGGLFDSLTTNTVTADETTSRYGPDGDGGYVTPYQTTVVYNPSSMFQSVFAAIVSRGQQIPLSADVDYSKVADALEHPSQNVVLFSPAFERADIEKFFTRGCQHVYLCAHHSKYFDQTVPLADVAENKENNTDSNVENTENNTNASNVENTENNTDSIEDGEPRDDAQVQAQSRIWDTRVSIVYPYHIAHYVPTVDSVVANYMLELLFASEARLRDQRGVSRVQRGKSFAAALKHGTYIRDAYAEAFVNKPRDPDFSTVQSRARSLCDLGYRAPHVIDEMLVEGRTIMAERHLAAQKAIDAAHVRTYNDKTHTVIFHDSDYVLDILNVKTDYSIVIEKVAITEVDVTAVNPRVEMPEVKIDEEKVLLPEVKETSTKVSYYHFTIVRNNADATPANEYLTALTGLESEGDNYTAIVKSQTFPVDMVGLL